MEIVRLAGPRGVGKTTLAWRLAQADAVAGRPVAFVDIDQLGMCYPAPDGDSGRWLLKEKALRRLALRYAAANVARLIVSGVALPDMPAPLNGDYPTHSIWLEAPEDTRQERLAERGWAAEDVARVAAIGSNESSRADTDWLRVDTHDQTPSQTIAKIRSLLATSPAEMSGDHDTDAHVPPDAFRALWLSGPRVVGTSTIGWAVAKKAWDAGQRTGFIDVRQLGFTWNVQRDVGASNAGALGHLFAEAGATDLVFVAPLRACMGEASTLLGPATITRVRVAADQSSRFTRIQCRREGRGPVLGGDDVYAASDAVIEEITAIGVTDARTPLRTDEQRLDTSQLSPAEAAAELRDRVRVAM